MEEVSFICQFTKAKADWPKSVRPVAQFGHPNCRSGRSTDLAKVELA